MKENRGRKSAASTEITTLAQKVSEVQIITYAEPPYELREPEANVWNATVRDKSPDWFTPSTYPLLMQYCRHVVRANNLDFMIDQYEQDIRRAASGQATLHHFDVGYDKLLTMQANQTRMIAHLATKMRLAQQSTIDEQHAKGGAIGKGKSGLWQRPAS
jgi:hypothetical protein